MHRLGVGRRAQDLWSRVWGFGGSDLGEDSGGGRKAEEKGGLELLDHLHEAHAFFQVAPAEARLRASMEFIARPSNCGLQDVAARNPEQGANSVSHRLNPHSLSPSHIS